MLRFFCAWLLIGLFTLLLLLFHVNTWEKYNPKPNNWESLMHEMDKDIVYSHVMQFVIVISGPISILVALLNIFTSNKAERK